MIIIIIMSAVRFKPLDSQLGWPCHSLFLVEKECIIIINGFCYELYLWISRWRSLFLSGESHSHVLPSQLLRRQHYREHHGVEALLHKQAKEKRLGTTSRHQNLPHLRCTYSVMGNRCTDKILPMTKYCLKRILSLMMSNSQHSLRLLFMICHL